MIKKINHKGYEYMCFYKDRKQYYPSVHRLVAEAFIPKVKGKEQINHIDGNKRNNCVTNLEWCTGEENIQHAMKTGLLNIIGGDNGKARKVLQLDIEGNVLRKFNSMAEAGRFLGVEGKPTGISKVCLGNKKTAYGHKWRYA